MSVADVSLDELQQRLVTFTQQLESIHELMQSDPKNAEYQNLALDLVEVIRLTKDMIDLKFSARNNSDKKPNNTTAVSSSEPQHVIEPTNLDFVPGSICEAQSKDVWFPAYIMSVTSSNMFQIHYLGFGNQDEVAASALRVVDRGADDKELPSKDLVPKQDITVGMPIRAKYYVDAQYYNAKVTNITAYGFQVLFDGYGNSEEVPYEYLRPMRIVDPPIVEQVAIDTTLTSTTTTTPTVTNELQPLEAVITKSIKIPDYLVVLPTDTEAEKERKRKRLKTIQKMNKRNEVENAHKIKQHGWQSFQHKAQKKGVKGSGVLSKRGSMFASPDTVEGRVGVVGSGQGMTVFEDTRKKLKTNHSETSLPPPF